MSGDSVPSPSWDGDRPLGVLADVHGNRWALEAVLRDVERRGLEQLVDLGDTVFGPLEPAATAKMLRSLGSPTVRGNQDRAILEAVAPDAGVTEPTLSFVVEELGDDDLAWLAGFPATRRAARGDSTVLLCHGTPAADDRVLVEEVTPGGVALAPEPELHRRLGEAGLAADLVLCGHSHVPRTVQVPGAGWIVNPGSVGLPAYAADKPFPFAMETGSPHARYAVLTRSPDAADGAFRVEHVAVPYDPTAAVATARRRGRADWARWLETGRG